MAFEPTPTNWTMLPRILAATNRVIICGPPGTGKTSIADIVARANNWTCHMMTMTPNMMASELLAMHTSEALKDDDGKFIGTQIVLKLSPAGLALRDSTHKRPSILILNEPDRGSEDALSILYMIADGGAGQSYALPNGDILEGDGSLRIVMTTNATDVDTFAPGILSRFPVILRIDDIAPAALATLSPDARRLATVPDSNLNRDLGIRPFQAFDQLVNGGFTTQEAASVIWGDEKAEEIARALEVASLPDATKDTDDNTDDND